MIKDTFKKINRSESFEQSANDLLILAEAAGMRESVSSIFATAASDYEIGMTVAKIFDSYGVIPTMKWLPEEIKALYASA